MQNAKKTPISYRRYYVKTDVLERLIDGGDVVQDIVAAGFIQ